MTIAVDLGRKATKQTKLSYTDMLMHLLRFLHVFIFAGNSMNSSQDLASYFECPVCFDYALPPIMQCQSGHIVCQSCRQKLTMCPTCRGPLGMCSVSGLHRFR